MSDVVEEKPKKKGKLGKILVLGLGMMVLVGGGVGAGLYAAGSGLAGGAHAGAEEDPNKPKLVPRSEQKRAGADEKAGKGGGGEAVKTHVGRPVPDSESAEPYASNYYAMEKEFTSNLQNSVHFVQVGIAVSTPYDDTVIERLKTHDIAIRSAILMTLGDTSEEQVFSHDGKKQLQRKLVDAINETLERKEGFGGIGNVYFTNFVVQ